MKIALVTEQLHFGRGGAERAMLEIVQCLQERDCAVTLYAGRLRQNKRVITLDEAAGMCPCSLQALPHGAGEGADVLRRLKREGEYDVVHSFSPLAGCDVFQPRGGSIRYSMERNIAAHPNAMGRWWSRVTAPMNGSRCRQIARERSSVEATDGPVVAALSDYVRRQFVDQYAVDPQRVRLVRNGVITDAYGSDEAREKGEQLRRLYDPDGERALFLFAAENLRLKGLGALIEGAARLVKKSEGAKRDFRILVVSNENYHCYWRQARRRGVGERIIFMGRTAEMPALLHMADAAVLPTYNDACSRVVMEALAAGTAVLTTRFNGAADFVRDGEHGVVLDDIEPEGIAAALGRLCDSRVTAGMAEAIGRDGLRDVVSMRRHVDELLGLYAELSSK